MGALYQASRKTGNGGFELFKTAVPRREQIYDITNPPPNSGFFSFRLRGGYFCRILL